MIKNWLIKILETPTLVSLMIGISLVLWQVGTGNLPPSVQIIFFVVVIFLTGIPHGAIDHLVEEETAKRQQKPFSLGTFLLRYILTMLFYGLMWYLFPSVSILLFLIISAWHFGETDIEKAPPTMLWNATRFVFGCFVLLWLLLFHAEETTPILARISQDSAYVLPFWAWAIAHFSLLLSLTTVFTVILFYFSNKYNAIQFNKTRFFRLCLILVLAYFLPLLPAFALYFGGWHALCSFHTIHDYLLEKRENLKTTVSLRSALLIWSKTLFFTFLAIVFLFIAGWYWLNFLQQWDPLPIIFIFLSLITLPHLNVMHQMNKNRV